MSTPIPEEVLEAARRLQHMGNDEEVLADFVLGLIAAQKDIPPEFAKAAAKMEPEWDEPKEK